MEPRGLNAIPLPYVVDEIHHHQVPAYSYGPQQLIPSFLKNLKQEDIILIILIVLLLLEGNDCDHLLVGILVVVFLSGFDGNLLGI
jgi:hypothetical protein